MLFRQRISANGAVMLHSRLMRYIDEVARTGSIRQAAERLAVASSAINRQIIAYEEELGLPVFERLSRGVRLTATGELLVEHIRATMKDHRHTLHRIGDLKTLRRSKINVATLEALTTDVLAQVVSVWHQSYPLTRISVMAMPADAIAAAVGRGDAQLGIGFDMPPQPNLTVFSSTRCSLGLVVRPDHPLANRASLRWSELNDCAFVLPAEGLTIRTLFDRAIKRVRLAVDPIVETNSIDLLKRLVMLGDVATVLTKADVEIDRQRGALSFIPITDSDTEAGSQSLVIVHRTSAPLDGITTRFAEKLVELAQQIGDEPPSKKAFATI